MQTSRRWQRPSAFALVLTVAATAAFVSLGCWQLARARAAQALLDAFEAAPSAAYEDFAALASRPPDSRYPHVRVHGRFLADRGYLRDERVHDGRVGIEAYAVFAVDGQTPLLLVDRGWLASTQAPGAKPALPPLSEDAVELSGIYAPFPGSGIRVGGNALQRQAAWPKLTLTLDAAEIAADLGKPLLPRVLLLDADSAGGFVREWTPAVMPPSRHQAYAFQWFAFAVAVLATFVVVHRIKREKETL